MGQFKFYAIQRVIIGVLFVVIALWAITFVLGFLDPPEGPDAPRDADHARIAHDTQDAADRSHDMGSKVKTDSPEHDVPGTAADEEASDSHGFSRKPGEPDASEQPDAHGKIPAAEADHGAVPSAVKLIQPRGVAFVMAAIEPLSYELRERFWGWRPNDIINFTDNVNSYQLGVLEVTRRTTVVLAERISRTGASDSFNKNLENAMNWLMIKSDDYWFPSPESKYKDSLDALKSYMEMLKEGRASFYTRTDNLIPLLQVFEDLMGSCEENLVKTDEKGGDEVSHFKADDYFFYAKGVAGAMGTILEAVDIDFGLTVESRRGRELLHDIIHACHHAQAIDPFYITNADLSGFLANHRANMAVPISHARFSLGVLIKTLST